MYSSSLFTIIIHTVQFIHHKVRTTHLRIIHTSTDDRGIAVARVGTINLWERRGRGDCYKKGKVGVDLHIKVTEGEMYIRNFDMFGSVMDLGQSEHHDHHHEKRTSASYSSPIAAAHSDWFPMESLPFAQAVRIARYRWSGVRNCMDSYYSGYRT